MITFDNIPAAESTGAKLLVLIKQFIRDGKVTYEIGYHTFEPDGTIKLVEVSIKQEIK